MGFVSLVSVTLRPDRGCGGLESLKENADSDLVVETEIKWRRQHC